MESEYFRIDVADPLGDVGDLGPAGVENEPRGDNPVGDEPLPDDNEDPREDTEPRGDTVGLGNSVGLSHEVSEYFRGDETDPRGDETDPLDEREPTSVVVSENTDSVSVCISSACKL